MPSTVGSGYMALPVASMWKLAQLAGQDSVRRIIDFEALADSEFFREFFSGLGMPGPPNKYVEQWYRVSEKSSTCEVLGSENKLLFCILLGRV